MKKRKNLLAIMGMGVALLMSGCGVDDSISDSFPSVPSVGGDGSGGHDTVKVDLLDTTTVRFRWQKNYRGYSEVLARREGDTTRYNYFMTSNTPGSYELTCYIDKIRYDKNKVAFACVNTGKGYLSKYNKLPDFTIDTIYDIGTIESVNLNNAGVFAKLRYNSTTNALEVRKP